MFDFVDDKELDFLTRSQWTERGALLEFKKKNEIYKINGEENNKKVQKKTTDTKAFVWF